MSDHFDGKKFFNPTLAEQFSPGFSDVLTMMREGRAKWPEAVENHGIARLHEKLEADDMALTFVNHATFLIQLPGLNILTDPVWSNRASPVSWVGPKRVRAPGIKLEDLPKVDVIVISHNHYDHLDIKTLKKLNELFSPRVIVPIGDKALVESIGIKNVQELDWWETVEINADIQITFTPTQHSSARILFDKDRSLWGSYFIKNRGRSVYFGGDSGYSTHYTEIKTRLGAPDIALLGIGSYAPRGFMKPVHMDPAEAVTAHKDLGAKLSIGMHFGTFQLAAEAFDEPQANLKEALEEQGLAQDNFITLHEGETRIYKRIRNNKAALETRPLSEVY
ncbi:MBL fold metallo-hydrolase [Rhizobium sp. 3T7]|uniref:MBL fold metallo-hydrolase n=1 Tax=Rhizobium sp. 3T7 TaxID=2874922 RepID=UPI001CCF21D8|nr:MBL fold metallo-hydrolase [Rhizobium sp. 3T7]MBZ9791639.1 MBL fold metallo-hydrolase [Rhizobium sp. 3T7]